MRPSENQKSNYAIKSTPATKTGPSIRLPVKKIYCSKCRRLVRGQVPGSKNTLQVVCPRCGRSLWSYKGISWRSSAPESD